MNMKTGRIKPGQLPQPTDARKGTVGRPRGRDVRPRGDLCLINSLRQKAFLRRVWQKDGKEEEVKDGGGTEEMERRMLPEATVSR